MSPAPALKSRAKENRFSVSSMVLINSNSGFRALSSVM
jgi:hypothetical protein